MEYEGDPISYPLRAAKRSYRRTDCAGGVHGKRKCRGNFYLAYCRREVEEVEVAEAIAGAGLAGDRYAMGAGSLNRKRPGRRQVALIDSIFFQDRGFEYGESRRDIVTQGVN